MPYGSKDLDLSPTMYSRLCWLTLGISRSSYAQLCLLTPCSVGAVLYTSYLQTLGVLHQPSSQPLKRVYPAPPVVSTFTAGFAAGAIQSVVAAPLDALQVRFRTSEILEGRYRSMWHYGHSRLKEIGFRGAFAGWGLSFVKDTMGYALFFATFEYVKAQGYYGFVTTYYGGPSSLFHGFESRTVETKESGNPVIKPHYSVEPTFLMLAGVAASVAQQIVQHPISLVQSIHYGSLANLDKQAKLNPSNSEMLHHYYTAYKKTYGRCLVKAIHAGGWRRWLYKGLLWNTLKQVPSTSAGLIIFELVRRRYGNEAEAVRIEQNGYDILLA